jgi:hypothetical protein
MKEIIRFVSHVKFDNYLLIFSEISEINPTCLHINKIKLNI